MHRVRHLIIIIVFLLALTALPAVAAPVHFTPVYQESLSELLKRLWTEGQLSFILGNMALNVIIAILASFRAPDPNDRFSLKRIADFLGSKMLPYGGSYIAAFLLGESSGLAWLAPAIFVVIETALAADLIDSLGRLGIPLPDAIKKLVSKPGTNVLHR